MWQTWWWLYTTQICPTVLEVNETVLSGEFAGKFNSLCCLAYRGCLHSLTHSLFLHLQSPAHQSLASSPQRVFRLSLSCLFIRSFFQFYLCRSCAGPHGHCKVLCETALSWLKDAACRSPPQPLLLSLPTSSPVMIPSLEWRKCDIDGH